MRLALLLAAGLSAYGQSLTFEVASIKPAPPPVPGMAMRVGCQGGPGSKDPGRWTCVNMSVPNLISMAYQLKPYELTGIDRFGGDHYEITAKVPEGVTDEQFREMQQRLLAERFGLKFHRERKEMAAYELVVGKNGPKLKESGPEPPPDAPPPPARPFRLATGKDGFPELPPGRPGAIMMNGMAVQQAVRWTTAQIATMLASQVGRPVVDATGLTGKYDYTLKWVTGTGRAAPPPSGAEGAVPAASEPAGPTIFAAIQEQLGLKLESKKAMVEVFVVDSVAKTPTEN